jgi:hypothetical protein
MKAMKTDTKALVGTVAAGAMAFSSASPALARDNGISAGEVIAGALIIGGIAAVAASAGDRDYGYDRAGYYDGDDRYGRHDRYEGNWQGDGARSAVQRCVAAAENQASRYGYGRADVTDIRDVRQTRWGYQVRGRIAVNTRGREWRDGDGSYGRGWNGDYRGWNRSMRGYDSGSFSCRIERGRVVDLDFDGIRGMRRY